MQKVQISVDNSWFSPFYCTDLVHFYLCHEKKRPWNLSAAHTYLGVRLYWEEELVTQEFRHISVLCDAPCTPSLFSLSSLWVLWRSGVERRGGWRWWRLAGQADIPCGQRTDGTRLLPHTSMPGMLRSAPVEVLNWCLLQRWGSPGSEGDYWGLRAKNSQSGRRPRRIN